MQSVMRSAMEPPATGSGSDGSRWTRSLGGIFGGINPRAYAAALPGLNTTDTTAAQLSNPQYNGSSDPAVTDVPKEFDEVIKFLEQNHLGQCAPAHGALSVGARSARLTNCGSCSRVAPPAT